MAAPDLETALNYCTYCPKLCRHACPVSNETLRETLTPRDKMATMKHLREGNLERTSEAAEALYGCTGCLACTTACHHGNTPGTHLMLGRAESERVSAGHAALAGLPERVRAHSVKAAAEARAAVAADATDAVAVADEAAGSAIATLRKASVAFIPGCEDPASARAALALFARVGIDAELAPLSLGCGGYPLLAGGFPEAFRMHAETVARELVGYERVVLGCPACAVTMSQDYPRHGVPLAAEVMHSVELLASVAERLPPVVRPGGDAFYHDPCYLGRHRGQYDAPRALLAHAQVSVKEFSRRRDEAECSGGGGVLPLTMPETSAGIARHRLEEVLETDTRTVVTACPTCRKQLTRDGVTARDLVDVLEEATR